MKQPPPAEAPQQDKLLNLLAWVEIHRKTLMLGFVALLAVCGAIYLWRQYTAQQELAGNRALLAIRQRPNQPESAPKPSDYLKVAEEHAATSVAIRARLLAAGGFFDDGRYAEARAEFEKVLAAAGSGPLAPQAAYGIAASLDAEKQVDAAAARYEDVIRQFPNSSVAHQARLALAGIAVSRQQPDTALRLYDEILQDREAVSAGQIALQEREELVRKNPQLAGASTNAPAP